MTDQVPATAGGDGAVGPAQVITVLIVVIAIVLLVILARGPEDQERSGAALRSRPP